MLRLRLTSPTRVWTAAIRHGRTAEVEWPPAPFRALAALVAGAHALRDDADTAAARAAIARIAACPPPLMWLPDMLVHTVPESYVAGTVIDWAKKPPKIFDLSLAVPGADDKRTKHLQHTVRCEWDHPCAFLDVDVDLEADELEALARAASAVPYVGRSTHPVEIGVVIFGPDGRPGLLAPDGGADVSFLEPGDAHQRWFPTELRAGAQTRCWTPEILTVLDEDHDARMHRGLRGLPDTVKGQPVSYVRGRRRDATGWVSLSLARKRRDALSLMASLATTNPTTAADALPVMAGSSVVAVLVDGDDAAVAAVTHHPDVFRGSGSKHPAVRRVEAVGRTWSTDLPAVAHPDQRVANAELAAELDTLFGEGTRVTSMRKLGPVIDIEELSGYERWAVTFTTSTGVAGPVRIGAGSRYGAGVCSPVRGREAVR